MHYCSYLIRTQISDNEWIYCVPKKESTTILCADRDPVVAPLMGAGRLSIDSTCKGYRKAALLQPLRSIKTNDSSSKENPLVQIQLNNESCEELGTPVNLSKLNLNLNFRQTISHADDLKYAGIKVRDLEKHTLEHDWKEKHSVLYHGYSTVVYIIVVLVCVYIVVRLIMCMKSKGLCQRVVGAFQVRSSTTANTEPAG